MKTSDIHIRKSLNYTKLIFGIGVIAISVIFLMTPVTEPSFGYTILGTVFIILGIGAIYLFAIEYLSHLKVPLLIIKSDRIEINQEVDSKIWNDQLHTWEKIQYKKQFITFDQISSCKTISIRDEQSQGSKEYCELKMKLSHFIYIPSDLISISPDELVKKIAIKT